MSAVVETLEEVATEMDKLYQERRTIARTERGEVWLWQGDGNDFPDSLACPVVMDADDLRMLLKTQNEQRDIVGQVPCVAHK